MWLHSPGNHKAEGSLLSAFSTLYYHDTTAWPPPTIESSLSGYLLPTELRTKKEDCPTPSSKPGLWTI